MSHILIFILLYYAVSISAVMLDRVIAVAQLILYRNMVQQKRLKIGLELFVVLNWNVSAGVLSQDCWHE